MYRIFFLFFTPYLLYALSPITPIKSKPIIDKDKMMLGKMLFNDTLLSVDKKISCASCHKPNNYYSDNKRYSTGVYEKMEKVNTPTVLNAVYNFRQFWNGRAKDIDTQLTMTLHNKIEMGMNDDLLIKRISNNKLYSRMIKKIYDADKISINYIKDAIGVYLQTLVTPNSKFDRYLLGKTKLTKEEEKGYRLFKKFGCIVCHNGKNIGGNSYQKMGIIIPVKNCNDDLYTLTHVQDDKCVYKVPTLRNVQMTAPYFHDGRAKTLKEAIKIMGYNNLGIFINDKDIVSIGTFLKTLTGSNK